MSGDYLASVDLSVDFSLQFRAVFTSHLFMPEATGEDMSSGKQKPTSRPSKGGCAIPCLLIFGMFIFTGILVSARPFGGALLALVVIGGAVSLFIKRDWQDNVFQPLGLNTKFKRYLVLGITIWLMLITFTSTSKEKADALWAKGKKSEAVELYVTDLERTSSPSPKILERVIEFYFENGNKEKAERICNMAIEADVELSPQSNELRDFFSSVREKHARKVEVAEIDVTDKPTPTAESETQKSDADKGVMVRATFWDDTEARPINDKAEIWFRGYGSWWLKPSTKFGGDVKELGKRKIGEKLTGDDTIVIYPDGRQTDEMGKEQGQRIDIPIKMFRSGEAYTTIEIGIGDKEIEISGFPVKEAIGKATYKVKRHD